MSIKKVITSSIGFTYFSLILVFAASAGTSETYRMDQLVFNSFGNTGTAGSKQLLVSGGEPVVGQMYGTSYSMQVGFFSDYYQTAPTPTVTGTPGVQRKYLKLYNNQINPILGEKVTIKWGQPLAGAVSITIFNLLGDRVITLVDKQNYTTGEYHQVYWDGKNRYGQIVGSGIYIVLVSATGFEQYGKVAVVK